MLTMSTGIECVRRTDVICDGSVVKSPEDVTVCTTESVRNVKHIPA